MNLFALSNLVKQSESQFLFDEVRPIDTSSSSNFSELFSAKVEEHLGEQQQGDVALHSCKVEEADCFSEPTVNAGAFGTDNLEQEKVEEKVRQRNEVAASEKISEDKDSRSEVVNDKQVAQSETKVAAINIFQSKEEPKKEIKSVATSAKERLSKKIENLFTARQEKIEAEKTVAASDTILKIAKAEKKSASEKKNVATLEFDFTKQNGNTKNLAVSTETLLNQNSKINKLQAKASEQNLNQEKVSVLKVKETKPATANSSQNNFSLKQDVASTLVKDLQQKAPTQVVESSKISTYLKESGVDSIVNQAKVILQGDNKGEINLILRPDNLGTVKIKLSLEEGSISGKILVDNNSVKEAFKGVLNDLTNSFINSGFEAANLDVFINNRQESNFAFSDFNKENATKTNGSKKESETINVVKSHYYKTSHSGVLNLVG